MKCLKNLFKKEPITPNKRFCLIVEDRMAGDTANIHTLEYISKEELTYILKTVALIYKWRDQKGTHEHN